MPTSHGNFVWYELMTTDTKAAEAFYRGVVGWGVSDISQPGMPYAVFTVGDDHLAGLMPTPDDAAGMPPCWFGYIGVDDVDAAAAKVESLGGTMHRAPCDIPGVGRFAVVGDPQGAGFMLFKGVGDAAPPSAAGWRELYAADWQAAFDFYAAMFGWTKDQEMDMGPHGVYLTFKSGDETIGGMMNKSPEMPAPNWNYYFKVESVTAAAERVKTGGGAVLMGPMEVPGGDWIVQCRDPQGAGFSLTSPTA